MQSDRKCQNIFLFQVCTPVSNIIPAWETNQRSTPLASSSRSLQSSEKKVKTIGCWWRADTNRGRDRKIEWNMTWICAPKECASVRPSFLHPSHVKQDEWLTISRMIWKNSSPLAYILHRREQHNKPINKRFFFADNWTDSAWRVQEGIDDDNDDGGDDHDDGAAKSRI